MTTGNKKYEIAKIIKALTYSDMIEFGRWISDAVSDECDKDQLLDREFFCQILDL